MGHGGVRMWGKRAGRSSGSPRPVANHLCCNPWTQNWFRTSSETARKKKNREQLSSSKEEKKKSTNGKKRGRKPKERPLETSLKNRESVAAKTNHKKSPEHWEGSRCSSDGDERGPKAPSQRKGGVSKVPEK